VGIDDVGIAPAMYIAHVAKRLRHTPLGSLEISIEDIMLKFVFMVCRVGDAIIV
jgi:hypothetical protein